MRNFPNMKEFWKQFHYEYLAFSQSENTEFCLKILVYEIWSNKRAKSVPARVRL